MSKHTLNPGDYFPCATSKQRARIVALAEKIDLAWGYAGNLDDTEWCIYDKCDQQFGRILFVEDVKSRGATSMIETDFIGRMLNIRPEPNVYINGGLVKFQLGGVRLEGDIFINTDQLKRMTEFMLDQ